MLQVTTTRLTLAACAAFNIEVVPSPPALTNGASFLGALLGLGQAACITYLQPATALSIEG